MSKNSKKEGQQLCDRETLSVWFQKAATKREELLIGIEHEKPIFFQDDFSPVPYDATEDKPGIVTLLEKIAEDGEAGWRRDYEGERLIGLTHEDGTNLSLEPGGQLEASSPPLRTLHEVADNIDRNIRETVSAAQKLGMSMLAMGYHPTKSGEEMPFIPKSRYEFLRSFSEKKHYDEMLNYMCCTSSAQVSVGYRSEEDMVKKLRVSLSLQPIVSALFATSPFKKGKPSGYESVRSHEIQGAMDGRFGSMMPVAFKEGFGFEKFTDHVLDSVPMMGVYRGKAFLDAHEGKFSDFMAGQLDVCPGQKPTLNDWVDYLNTNWPEVRLRRSLEMRGADVGPAEMLKALPALWVGLLYNDDALDKAYDLVKNWTDEDRDYLRTVAPRDGLQTKFKGGTLQDIALKMIDIAEEGLKERAVLDVRGQDESGYLAPVREVAETGLNWSQRLMQKYENEWQGDIRHVFEEMDYTRAPSVMPKPEEQEPAARKPARRAAAHFAPKKKP